MLSNHIRMAWRHLIRRKGYTLLNVFGLSIGIAGLILIGLYLRHELSYETVHERSDRIFRVVVDRHYEQGRTRRLAPTSPPLADAVRDNVPEAEETVRMFVPKYTTGRVALRSGDRGFFEERFFFADPSVFDVFSIPLLRGDAGTALQRAESVIVSESMAKKYFPGENPLGRMLVLDDSITVQVTGVMADLPSNTHIRPDFLAPYALLEHQYGDPARRWWGWDVIYTYVLLRDRDAQAAARRKIQEVIDATASPRTARRGYTYSVALQPLGDIHLHSDREWEITKGGDPVYLKALAAIALFVLMLACINFVNLSTARAASRAREIGVRKVLGSGPWRLMVQFLCESTLLSLGAVLLGAAAALAALPFVNGLTGAELTLQPWLIPLLLLVAVIVGVGAGGYPAFYLSSLRPTAPLQGGFSPRGGRRGRHLLVVSQFTISIVLTAGTLIVYQQISYMKSQELGFDEEQVLVVSSGGLTRDPATAKQELMALAGVERVATASGVPGRKTELMQITPEGHDQSVPVHMLFVDADFVETLGLEVAAGRDFDPARGADAESAYVVNEAAVRAFGWSTGVGKTISWTSGWGIKEGEVIGVVRDFHTASLRDHVQPLVMTMVPDYRAGYLALRVQSANVPSLLGDVGVWWNSAAPGRPFEYGFLDDVFGSVYAGEQTQARIFSAFAVLAMLVACMGLFGLAAHTAESRTKEIGVRKVLGATVLQIYSMLSCDYARFVVLALIAAVPITYLTMERWLDGFAYRIEIGPGIFLTTGLGMLGIALATVGYLSLRAALADPVNSIRSE